MKKYFYAQGSDTFGPFTCDELKAHRIAGDTLVWAENMPNWVAAKSIPELSDSILIVPQAVVPPVVPQAAVPPPIPQVAVPPAAPQAAVPPVVSQAVVPPAVPQAAVPPPVSQAAVPPVAVPPAVVSPPAPQAAVPPIAPQPVSQPRQTPKRKSSALKWIVISAVVAFFVVAGSVWWFAFESPRLERNKEDMYALDYLDVSANWKKNMIGSKVNLYGEITSSAKYAVYRKVTLKIDFYDDEGTLFASEYAEVNDIYPLLVTSFSVDVPNHWGSQRISCNVKSAF